MPVELALNSNTPLSFLFVLVRVSGAFVFLPLPGLRQGFSPIRIFLSMAFPMALLPMWPALPEGSPTFGTITAWIAAEAVFGIGVGLCLAVVLEVFILAAQMLSLQSGLSYASTVDPTSIADSGAMIAAANLSAGLLMFATGLHRDTLLAFAKSFALIPPGGFVVHKQQAVELIQFGGAIFSTGLRIALPVMAFLFLVDLAISLLGRFNPGLQLFAFSFPLKIFVTLFIYSFTMLLFPRVFERLAASCMTHIYRVMPGGV